MPSGQPSRHLRAYLILALMPLLFVSNIVVGRAAVGVVEPWTLAFLRWLLASLMLLPFGLDGVRRHAGHLARQGAILLLLGFLGMWVCGGILYVALAHTTATNATLIFMTSPVAIVALGAAVRRERLTAVRMLGIASALVGVATIVLRGDLAGLATLRLNPGDLGIIAAALAWAIYTILHKRDDLQSIPSSTLFLAVAIAGTATLLPMTVWEVASLRTFPTGLVPWIAILAIALVPSVLAFSAFQYGIKVVGPSATSMFMYLLPFYGVTLSVVFLGEELHLYHAAGLAFVLAGILLATRTAAVPQSRAR